MFPHKKVKYLKSFLKNKINAKLCLNYMTPWVILALIKQDKT